MKAKSLRNTALKPYNVFSVIHCSFQRQIDRGKQMKRERDRHTKTHTERDKQHTEIGRQANRQRKR